MRRSLGVARPRRGRLAAQADAARAQLGACGLREAVGPAGAGELVADAQRLAALHPVPRRRSAPPRSTRARASKAGSGCHRASDGHAQELDRCIDLGSRARASSASARAVGVPHVCASASAWSTSACVASWSPSAWCTPAATARSSIQAGVGPRGDRRNASRQSASAAACSRRAARTAMRASSTGVSAASPGCRRARPQQLARRVVERAAVRSAPTSGPTRGRTRPRDPGPPRARRGRRPRPRAGALPAAARSRAGSARRQSR